MNPLIKIVKKLTLEEQEYFILCLCNLMSPDGRTLMAGDGFSMNDLWRALTRPDAEILDALLKTQSEFGDRFSFKGDIAPTVPPKVSEPKLIDALDMLRDELLRIKACPGATDEIKGLCDRARLRTEQTTPVIEQRDAYADLVDACRVRFEKLAETPTVEEAKAAVDFIRQATRDGVLSSVLMSNAVTAVDRRKHRRELVETAEKSANFVPTFPLVEIKHTDIVVSDANGVFYRNVVAANIGVDSEDAVVTTLVPQGPEMWRVPLKVPGPLRLWQRLHNTVVTPGGKL